MSILRNKWENEQCLMPNGAQLAAMKSALSKDLTLIQGPPGTGKTFVALQIMKSLLDNTQYWMGGEGIWYSLGLIIKL